MIVSKCPYSESINSPKSLELNHLGIKDSYLQVLNEISFILETHANLLSDRSNSTIRGTKKIDPTQNSTPANIAHDILRQAGYMFGDSVVVEHLPTDAQDIINEFSANQKESQKLYQSISTAFKSRFGEHSLNPNAPYSLCPFNMGISPHVLERSAAVKLLDTPENEKLITINADFEARSNILFRKISPILNNVPSFTVAKDNLSSILENKLPAEGPSLLNHLIRTKQIAQTGLGLKSSQATSYFLTSSHTTTHNITDKIYTLTKDTPSPVFEDIAKKSLEKMVIKIFALNSNSALLSMNTESDPFLNTLNLSTPEKINLARSVFEKSIQAYQQTHRL